MGRFEKLEISIKPLEKDQEYQQGYDEVHYINIAQESYLSGDSEAALRYYSRALGYKLDIEKAWVGQVSCLVDLGEFNEAIVWADKGLEVIPDSSGLLAMKAMALGRVGEMERAIAWCDRAFKKGTNSSMLWLARGDIVISSNFKNGLFCFRKATECNPKDVFTYLRIGISLLSIGVSGQSLSYLKKAHMLNPESALIPFLIGNAYGEVGMKRAAINWYKKALKLKPNYHDAMSALEHISRVAIIGEILGWFRRVFRR